MRLSSWRRPTSRGHAQASTSTSWLLTLTSLASLSQAVTINPIPGPNLDVSQLGQMGIAGDFNGLSLYQFEGQTEQAFSTNGTEQLMTRLPNGAFINLASADASILTMCVFQGQVIMGGNFTSLGGQESPGIASFDPSTGSVGALSGLSGQVNSLLCDDSEGKVYVGGNFRAADSTNAITWLASNSWASLPFAGFNGPVDTIAKAPSGHVIFGGSFTGLGNTSTPTTPDAQTINLSTANISDYQGTSTTGFSDPKNIVCKTDGTSGEGNTWLAQDNAPSAWSAQFGFGFVPTKLRLYNTHLDGRGTKTWRFTAQPNNGIMNFTYIDPSSGQNQSCTSECPLSDDSSVEFQDFFFVNNVGMNAFRIDISAWYGSGAGLNGIELFEDNIFTYAINDFNDPSCANTTTPSEATTTGSWSVTESGSSNSQYLSAVVQKPITSDAASVVFRPDIKEAGDYIVKMYTPGCSQDNTCSRRGQVSITGTLAANETDFDLLEDIGGSIYQTNDFDKYDQIYIGYIDATSDSFRPSITLSPKTDQSISSDDLVIVAQRIGFELQNSTGGLVGLFEYDPSQATVDTNDFSSSAYDKLGSTFSTNSAVATLVAGDEITYIGGNFTSSNVSNIVAVDGDGNSVALDGGLNGQVLSMYLDGDQLYAGGSFNSTQDGTASGLSNVAVYDRSGNKWTPLGAGVDGTVRAVVPLAFNLTDDTTENLITLTGDFQQILAFDDNEAREVTGFAVWVVSQGNWLQNLDMAVPFWNGFLSTSLLGNSDIGDLYTGSLASQVLRANGAASTGNGLGSFPIQIQSTTSSSSTSSLSKRESILNNTDSITGIITGAFDASNDRNNTILGGHFTAQATNGSTIYNLAVIDRKNSDSITGLGPETGQDSVILALGLQGDNLFAGGRINGTIDGTNVKGLLSYNLASSSYNTQPPVLAGDDVAVSTIALRPDTSDIYVGGSFDTAGSLPCPGVCVLGSTNQWTRPGLELSGTVNAMMWTSDSVLIAGGNLTINGATVFLASYDASNNAWTGFSDASQLPGPVDALTAADKEQDQVWVTGTQSDGSNYLMKYDGSSWQSAGITFDPDTVVSSLQIFSVTKAHDSSDLIDRKQVLLLTGSIAIPDYGQASGAIFNGTTVQPYLLTSSVNSTSGAGSVSRVFVQFDDGFFTSSSKGGLAVGFVVLIALAISLGLILMIVAAGLALDRYRKKRDGYVSAPTSMYDRGSGMQRIPPHELLDSLRQGRPGAPHV
ncbi:cellular morphogenesis protein [Xylariaceae sp. FL0016]|nr:cellular morphogenesis protein [Xylariaceae sp. FL0016]